MDGWDVALLAIVAYAAIVILVRMALGRREHLLAEVRKRLKEHAAKPVEQPASKPQRKKP